MIRRGPFWLDPDDAPSAFPSPRLALMEPNGLLAVGGDLSVERLLSAYRQGIFPWYSEGQPILWWTPEPRAVMFPDRIRISRSLRKTLRRNLFTITMDQAFVQVMEQCAAPRPGEPGTWITEEMVAAYRRLHELGFAHSVESWRDGELVGGLYGVALGRVFYGESMFSRISDASKVAYVHLVRQLEQWGFGIIDCQMSTGHLQSLGAEEISRERFMGLLNTYCEQPPVPAPWHFDQEADDERQ